MCREAEKTMIKATQALNEGKKLKHKGRKICRNKKREYIEQ